MNMTPCEQLRADALAAFERAQNEKHEMECKIYDEAFDELKCVFPLLERKKEIGPNVVSLCGHHFFLNSTRELETGRWTMYPNVHFWGHDVIYDLASYGAYVRDKEAWEARVKKEEKCNKLQNIWKKLKNMF